MMRLIQPVFVRTLADVYVLYIQKAERKKYTKEQIDQTVCWLTGYNQAGLQQKIKQGNDANLGLRLLTDCTPTSYKLSPQPTLKGHNPQAVGLHSKELYLMKNKQSVYRKESFNGRTAN
jgi:hypothetical protein